MDYLRHAGLEPRHAMDGHAALEIAATWRPDLVVARPGSRRSPFGRNPWSSRAARTPKLVRSGSLAVLPERTDKTLFRQSWLTWRG